MGGTTDTLLGYARMSSGWVRQTLMQGTHEASVSELRRALAERHLLAAREVVDPERLPEVEGRIVDLLGELEAVIEASSEYLRRGGMRSRSSESASWPRSWPAPSANRTRLLRPSKQIP